MSQDEAEVPHYHGHRERLRDRFREAGADALADYELIELLLFRAIPRRDVKPLAKALLAKFGSFVEVVSAPSARLREVEDMTESAATELKIVEAAAHRFARGKVVKRKALGSMAEVIDYCRTRMAFADHEEFRVLFLDRKNGLIDDAAMGSARSITCQSIRARSSSARSNSLPPP